MQEISETETDILKVAYGSVWYPDHARKRIVEHLGRALPSLQFVRGYLTEEAALADCAGYKAAPLSGKLRLPTGTPVPRISNSARSHEKIQRDVFVVDFSDIVGKGIEVFRVPVVTVEFDAPPAYLSGEVDLVATFVVAGHDGRFRICLGYGENMRPYISENPLTERGHVFLPDKTLTAFLTEGEAFNEADTLSGVLKRACDWRARYTG